MPKAGAVRLATLALGLRTARPRPRASSPSRCWQRTPRRLGARHVPRGSWPTSPIGRPRAGRPAQPAM